MVQVTRKRLRQFCAPEVMLVTAVEMAPGSLVPGNRRD